MRTHTHTHALLTAKLLLRLSYHVQMAVIGVNRTDSDQQQLADDQLTCFVLAIFLGALNWQRALNMSAPSN